MTHIAHVRGPAELVAVLPHLVGFDPGRSIVLLHLAQSSGRVVLTVRMDPPAAPDELNDVLEVLEHSRAAAGTSRLAIVVTAGPSSSGPRPGVATAGAVPLPHPSGDIRGLRAPLHEEFALAEALRDHCHRQGIDLLDVLVVGEAAWSSLLAPHCGARHAVEGRTEGDEAVLPLIVSGSAPEPSRRELAAALCPSPSHIPLVRAVARMLRTDEPRRSDDVSRKDLCTQRRERLDRAASVLLTDVEGTDAIGPGDAAEVLDAVMDVGVRDALLRRCLVGACMTDPVDPDGARSQPDRCGATQVSGPDLRRAASRMRRIAVLAPPSHRAAAYGLLAALCWAHGDGVRATLAAEHALAADPEHSLSLLLLRAISSCMPPRRWVEAVLATAEEDCLLGRP